MSHSSYLTNRPRALTNEAMDPSNVYYYVRVSGQYCSPMSLGPNSIFPRGSADCSLANENPSRMKPLIPQ